MAIMKAYLTMQPNLTAFDVKTFQKNKKIIGNNDILTNICRTHACDSIICGYFCIGFIDFMLKGKSLLDHTNFS